MKRRLVVIGLGALALATVLSVVLWPRGPRPCRATFDQVRGGMTFDEVCATVGPAPGDYLTKKPMIFPTSPMIYEHAQVWTADDGCLIVYLDGSGRVEHAQVAEVICLADPPFWSRLRARLGL
jgi:hypothetical protein